MDIETKIALCFLICFVAGLLIGWYVTWQTYHQEDEKRKAVANAINQQKTKWSEEDEKHLETLDTILLDDEKIGGKVYSEITRWLTSLKQKVEEQR